MACVINIHKSQESTLAYMIGDLNCTTRQGPNIAVVNKCQCYSLLSGAEVVIKLN